MLTIAFLCSTADAGDVRRFPDAPVVWVDDDMQPLSEPPEEYWSGLAWDGVDQTLFRPLHRGLSIQVGGPADNVNAWDEVPDSSWFVNRLGVRAMSDNELAQGACPDDRLDPSRTWTVTAAKPNGANPGFIIKGPDGRGWLLKMDGTKLPERATTADVLGSRLYYAAGFHSPCNIIVHFERDIFEIAPDAESEDELGNDVPMTQVDVDKVLESAGTLPDGRLRASASLFLPGRPLGPWTYQGMRKDDANDVIPHQDRRDVRGGKLISAWINHFDAREQNTLSIWREVDGGGYVEHYMLDFGDTLGSVWWWVPLTMSQRFGYSYYFDAGDVAVDYLTLGLLSRPWNKMTLSETAPVGYFEAEQFRGDRYKPGYPNPAFLRMDEGDGAWMARILARMDEETVATMLDEGHMTDPAQEAQVLRLLMARQHTLLEHWLLVRSPLADVTVDGDQLCFTDLAAQRGLHDVGTAEYGAAAFHAPFTTAAWTASIPGDEETRCVTLPDLAQPPADDPYSIVDLSVSAGDVTPPPLRLHLMGRGEDRRLVGIERPADDEAPGR